MIKIARVLAQTLLDRPRRQRRKILPRLLHPMPEALRMRIVRPEEKFVVAGKIHDILEPLFLGVAADPDVAREILVHRPLHLRRMPHVLVAIVDPLEPFADPSDHRLDRSRAQPRKRSNTPSTTIVVSAWRGSWMMLMVKYISPGFGS